MADYTGKLKALLQSAGCRFERHGKGDHDIWYSPKTGVHFFCGQQNQITSHGECCFKTGGIAQAVLKEDINRTK